ncbi:MAG: FmdB family zinc ribbon protein [bacterium]
MPTYEYQCQKCGLEFEVFHAMSAKPIRKCEKCGGPVKRLVSSGTGLIFKGSGFYITDYARKNSTGEPAKSEKSGKELSSSGATAEKSSTEKKSSETTKSSSKSSD